MTTAQNMGNQQMQSAVSQGETAMSGANALAAGKIGVSNAYSNALSGMGSGAGNAFNQAMSYYNQQNALYNQGGYQTTGGVSTNLGGTGQATSVASEADWLW